MPRLINPTLAHTIGPFLDEANAEDVRDTAIQFVRACQLEEQATALADLALNDAAPHNLRTHAIYGLMSLEGAAEQLSRLNTLIAKTRTQPGDEELRGLALQACWPKFLSASELFEVLTPPRGTATATQYRDFLYRFDVAETVQVADLPAALDWAIVHGADRGPHAIARIAGSIAVLAWHNSGRPGVLDRLVTFIRARTASHLNPFHIEVKDESVHADSNAAVVAMITESPAIRRAVVSALIEKAESSSDVSRWCVYPCCLLRREDFTWLLEQVVASTGLRAAHWAHAAGRFFDHTRSEHVDAWLAAKDRSAEVARAMSYRTVVTLKSKDDSDERAVWNEMQRPHRQEEPVALDPPPPARVAMVLSKCLNGAPEQFYQLLSELTLSEDSTHYWTDIPDRLDEFPGWQVADSTTREQISLAAAAFLNTVPESAEDSVSDDGQYLISDMSCAFAALHLVKNSPRLFGELDKAVWKAWARPLVVQLVDSNDGNLDETQTLFDVLMRDAPAESRKAVLSMIDRANRSRRFANIAKAWGRRLDRPLVSALVERLKTLPHSAGWRCDALCWLLDSSAEGAKELLRELVERLPPHGGESVELTIATAAIACRFETGVHWDRLVVAMKADEAWARQLITQLFDHHEIRGNVFTLALNESQCVAMWIWLVERYPYEKYSFLGTEGIQDVRDAVEARRMVLEKLRAFGTRSACAELEKLARQFPQYEWMRDVVLEANAVRLRASWQQPSLQDLRTLIAKGTSRLVRSDTELLEAAVESLKRLEQELHGSLPARRDLWDAVGDRHFKPLQEEAISDYLARWFRKDLVDIGIVVNREVQIRRKEAKGSDQLADGERTDIILDAISNSQGVPSVVRAIIEVKGQWHKSVKGALNGQLVSRYLAFNECRAGLYLVAWFESSAWDPEDSRSKLRPWSSKADAQSVLSAQAHDASAGRGLDVRAVVLDCRLV